MKKEKRTIYLAGALFGAGDQTHNLLLEAELKKLKYRVVLPQRQGEKVCAGGKFNLEKVIEDCRVQCTAPDRIFVGCIDGTDADSGTSVEYGLAIGAFGKAILYRTDFRTNPENPEKEIGINGMFTLKETRLVYYPSQPPLTKLSQIKPFYKALALKIDEAIKELY